MDDLDLTPTGQSYFDNQKAEHKRIIENGRKLMEQQEINGYCPNSKKHINPTNASNVLAAGVVQKLPTNTKNRLGLKDFIRKIKNERLKNLNS